LTKLLPSIRVPQWFGALQEREFALLFVARTVSLFGSAITPIALAFAVLRLTGSASDLGFVLAARVVPQILFLLVGGIWADRLPRHLVMVGSNIANGVTQAATAALLLAHSASVWQLAVLQAANGAAFAFFLPASTGLVPQAVSAARLQQANALLRISINGSQIGGAAIGGVLVATIGASGALLVDAFTFFGSAALLALMRLPRGQRMPARNFLVELREGWQAFRSRAWLSAMVAQVSLVNAAQRGPFLVLGPVVAARHLGGATAWGLILSAQAGGLFLGGFFGLRFRPRRPLVACTWLVFALALPLLALGLTLPTIAIAAAALLSGIAVEVFGVLWDTTVQEEIPADVLSRVSSYDQLGSFGLIPIALALSGPLASAVGISATLFGAAAIVVLATAPILLLEDVRAIHRRELRPEAEAVAPLASQ
jgi:predicted MFS family arabinose efflux permease